MSRIQRFDAFAKVVRRKRKHSSAAVEFVINLQRMRNGKQMVTLGALNELGMKGKSQIPGGE